MVVEQLLNSKEVIDYEIKCNNKGNLVMFALIKSDAGKYSIRQAFRNVRGEWNGFKVVNLLGTNMEYVAQAGFDDFLNSLTF